MGGQCDEMSGYDTWTLTGTAEKFPAVKWSRSRATSCFEGHGAKDLEVYKGVPLGAMSFPECKAMCNFLPDCEGIVMEFDLHIGNSWCYRRSSIDLKSCVRGDQQAWALPFDTWVKVKSDDAALTRRAEENGIASCPQLQGDDCTANRICRWCEFDDLRHYPHIFESHGCVSAALADGFIADGQCARPSQDPCDAHTSAKDCHDNGCHYCEGLRRGQTACVSEISGFPGYCDDTVDHEAGYKACAALGSQFDRSYGSQQCEASPVCTVCVIQVSASPSNSSYQKICVDKDSVGSWCKGTSS